MITIIVAYNQNRVIADSTGIPWKISEDMNHFKAVTMGNPCIMGRKTWNSLPPKFRPLPGRRNIVVTRNPSGLYIESEIPHFIDSIPDAIKIANTLDPGKEVFIIGGGEIYKQTIALADRILASEVKGFVDVVGTAFFPQVNWESKVLAEHDQFNVVEYKK